MGMVNVILESTLLMALLRAVNIPNRLHGFTIDKALQKGAITGIWYEFTTIKDFTYLGRNIY